MLRRGGLGKGEGEGYQEAEVGEEDKSGALTQQAEKGVDRVESWNECVDVCAPCETEGLITISKLGGGAFPG